MTPYNRNNNIEVYKWIRKKGKATFRELRLEFPQYDHSDLRYMLISLSELLDSKYIKSTHYYIYNKGKLYKYLLDRTDKHNMRYDKNIGQVSKHHTTIDLPIPEGIGFYKKSIKGLGGKDVFVYNPEWGGDIAYASKPYLRNRNHYVIAIHDFDYWGIKELKNIRFLVPAFAETLKGKEKCKNIPYFVNHKIPCISGEFADMYFPSTKKDSIGNSLRGTTLFLYTFDKYFGRCLSKYNIELKSDCQICLYRGPYMVASAFENFLRGNGLFITYRFGRDTVLKVPVKSLPLIVKNGGNACQLLETETNTYRNSVCKEYGLETQSNDFNHLLSAYSENNDYHAVEIFLASHFIEGNNNTVMYKYQEEDVNKGQYRWFWVNVFKREHVWGNYPGHICIKVPGTHNIICIKSTGYFHKHLSYSGEDIDYFDSEDEEDIDDTFIPFGMEIALERNSICNALLFLKTKFGWDDRMIPFNDSSQKEKYTIVDALFDGTPISCELIQWGEVEFSLETLCNMFGYIKARVREWRIYGKQREEMWETFQHKHPNTLCKRQFSSLLNKIERAESGLQLAAICLEYKAREQKSLKQAI